MQYAEMNRKLTPSDLTTHPVIRGFDKEYFNSIYFDPIEVLERVSPIIVQPESRELIQKFISQMKGWRVSTSFTSHKKLLVDLPEFYEHVNDVLRMLVFQVCHGEDAKMISSILKISERAVEVQNLSDVMGCYARPIGLPSLKIVP